MSPCIHLSFIVLNITLSGSIKETIVHFVMCEILMYYFGTLCSSGESYLLRSTLNMFGNSKTAGFKSLNLTTEILIYT